MGHASVEFRYQTVHKVYPEQYRHLAAREVAAYQALPWAAPRLLYHGEGWLETERCIPILDIGFELNQSYREALRKLIRSVNDAGWWHCDIALENVVIHPTRGPLLIDWENARPATSEVSYDLYGARAAGVSEDELYPGHEPDGVWWGGPWPHCPGPYWGVRDGSWEISLDGH